MCITRMWQTTWILVAIIAASGIAASTVSAKRAWFVGTGELPNGEGAAKPIGTTKLVVNTKARIEVKVFGIKQKVECGKAVLSGKIYNIEPAPAQHTARDKTRIELKECSSTFTGCAVTEPILLPEKQEEESVVVETKEKVFDDFLPEGVDLFTIVKCGTTSAPIESEVMKRKGGEAKEGEGGIAAEVFLWEDFTKKIHVFKFKCPPEVTRVFNWKGEEVIVNKLKEEGCFSAEIEVELLSKENYAIK